MPQESPPSLSAQSAFHSGFARYGLAVFSVAVALGIAFFLASPGFRGIEFPLLLMAIALTVWYAGNGPAIIALIISALAFDYFFTPPLYSLAVTRHDLPYYVMFVLFSSLLAWFTAIRRRVERELLRSRNELQKEVVLRTQQASLLNLTHDTIFVRDTNDVITYWNRGAEEMYGWSAEQAVGKRSHDLLQTVFPAPLADIHAELFRAGRWEGELRNTKADKTSLFVASRWSLQQNAQGSPIAVLETNNDITERKRGEQEIRDLNRELGKRAAELEATNKELEAFAYSISHDLRAPLRHMAGFAELLQKHASAMLDEKSRRYLAMIMEAAKRMGTLIDDLLAFSRIGRSETRQTAVSLEQLVREVKDEVAQEANGGKIHWKLGTLPDLYGDPSMLKLAFVNLLANAVKFSRTRSQPEIEIGSMEMEKEKHSLVVFVKDNGVGFDMKYVNKLFGVFQRLHRGEEYEGTGIGLATVQRIVHRHGGQVWAEGLVDNGATFYLSFPKR